MSCNGCRVLRRGCSDNCSLRPCLVWINCPHAQANATVFVSKFFGRRDLMSFIAAVPDSKKPALFQSLLYEACGRTVNPVNGAVGLLSTGNWRVCQEAVETVLAGGTLRPMFGVGVLSPELNETSEAFRMVSGRVVQEQWGKSEPLFMHGSNDEMMTVESDVKIFLPAVSFRSSEMSDVSASFGSYDDDSIKGGDGGGKEPKLLDLFV